MGVPVKILVVDHGTSLTKPYLEPFIDFIGNLFIITETLKLKDCSKQNLITINSLIKDKVYQSFVYEFNRRGYSQSVQTHCLDLLANHCDVQTFKSLVYSTSYMNLCYEFYPVIYVLI